MNRKSYPTDVSDEEWAFVAPYLTLMKEVAPQREYPLRELFNALRWIIRAGAPWRMLPHDFPRWETVYQQAQRWIKWGCFEALVHDLRVLSREGAGKEAQPTAVVFDSRTVQSSAESGDRAGFDGNKRRKGSKVHLAVDTLGNLLALVITAANEQERAQVGELCQAVQVGRNFVSPVVTGQNVKLAYADQGYTGETAGAAAATHGVELEIVKHTEAKKGFVVLPKRWIVERCFAWTARYRRLARDYERLPETLAGLHFAFFAGLMLVQARNKGLLAPHLAAVSS